MGEQDGGQIICRVDTSRRHQRVRRSGDQTVDELFQLLAFGVVVDQRACEHGQVRVVGGEVTGGIAQADHELAVHVLGVAGQTICADDFDAATGRGRGEVIGQSGVGFRAAVDSRVGRGRTEHL